MKPLGRLCRSCGSPYKGNPCFWDGDALGEPPCIDDDATAWAIRHAHRARVRAWIFGPAVIAVIIGVAMLADWLAHAFR